MKQVLAIFLHICFCHYLASCDEVYPKKADRYSNLFLKTTPRPQRQMGFIVDPKINSTKLSGTNVEAIKAALVEHGVVVLRNQNLTRKQQMELTEALGVVVKLPRFLAVKDVEPGFENQILRVTNYDSKGKLKDPAQANGQYWHKDGDYYQNDYIGTVLYADQIGRGNVRPTLFLDNCVMGIYPQDLWGEVEDFVNAIDISQIEDFVVRDDDLKEFPAALHPLDYKHPGDGRSCMYLTQPIATETDVALESCSDHIPKSIATEPDNQQLSNNTKEILMKLWSIMLERSPRYEHHWREGDVLIWDNSAVMHRTGVIDKSAPESSEQRTLYRTQYFI